MNDLRSLKEERGKSRSEFGDYPPRAEHLAWCKERALAYVAAGDLKGAFQSFQSDMQKHPELCSHPALSLMATLFVTQQLSTAAEMSRFIQGFN